MRKQFAIATTAFVLASAAWSKAPIPRPAQELTIIEPSGKLTLLTRQKGDVVLVQFLFTTCQHCQAAARIYSKLQKELGPQGFKVFGVAFNDGVQESPQMVRDFISSNGIAFPVGTASRDTVLGYLGIPVMSRMAVPQILIVDRKGMVRAQSDYLGSDELQDESYLRTFIEGLLKEHARGSKQAPATAR
jgi:thiol-disulfide isomerase/thioredoxin